ncbi:MAG: hypothetical protein AAGG02_08780 [Cyanobacteria bacterium P01_H01_bin.15]
MQSKNTREKAKAGCREGLNICVHEVNSNQSYTLRAKAAIEQLQNQQQQ